MPQTCSVCKHKARTDIELSILRKESLRDIAGHWKLSKSAIDRHRPHILVDLIQAEHSSRLENAIKVLDEVLVLKETAFLLRDACDRELRDPEDSTRYYVGPRSWDVEVTYEDQEEIGEDENGNPKVRRVRRKGLLSELLKDVPGVISVKINQPHPVDMILKTVDRWIDSLKLVAQLTGELRAAAQVNVQANTQVNVGEKMSPAVQSLIDDLKGGGGGK